MSRTTLSVSCMCLPKTPLPDALNALAALGVGRTSVQAEVVRRHGWAEGVRTLRSSALEVCGLVGPYPPALFTEESWQASRADLVETVQAAATLECRCVYMVTGPATVTGRAEATEVFASFIEPVVDYAHTVGVQLAIEPTLPQFAWVSFVHSLEEALEMNQMTGMSVCLDLFHLWKDETLSSFLTDHIDLVALVQVGDSVPEGRTHIRAVLGDGAIPVSDIISAVDAAGYRGIYDIEQYGPRMDEEGPLIAVERAVQTLEVLVGSTGRTA